VLDPSRVDSPALLAGADEFTSENQTKHDALFAG
jgi:hypothetical protein